jgi:hypothetical protein
VAELDYLVDQLDSEDPWTEKHRSENMIERDVDDVDVLACACMRPYRTW